ncbi:unnamed protein product [Peronospora destructor]|uniref:Glycoside hydrolase 131 catalytic N-terminal domain-containing protein n=1 Tax=Peronospora destructor TaxID=86335 RepID=A0AAV0SX90_9STRA|nr:unnamed protein product [Peronospora destructor]
MVFFSGILGMVALSSAYLAAPAAGASKPIPWSGRGKGLTVETIETEYLTHILTMRNNSKNNNVSRYVSIEQEARSPSYNGDTGVINIGVDANAIFKEQFNFRRSELVQFVDSNANGPTFFRGSLKKKEAFHNEYVWQCFFTETHIFEIRVDATASAPKIIYINNNTWDAKWEADFELDTWYNFGFEINKAATGSGSVIAFYTSTGADELKLEATHTVVSEFLSVNELHIGLLTLSDDGSQPVMADKQDVISFSGVSVEAKVGVSATVTASTAESVANK